LASNSTVDLLKDVVTAKKTLVVVKIRTVIEINIFEASDTDIVFEGVTLRSMWSIRIVQDARK
jgi:hypothetical protein